MRQRFVKREMLTFAAQASREGGRRTCAAPGLERTEPDLAEDEADWAAAPLIDRMVVRDLHDALDDLEVITALLSSFEETTDDLIVDMAEGLAKTDWDRVRRGAHSIKGAAGNIGARRVSMIAAVLENALRAEDTSAAEKYWPVLKDAVEATRAEIGKGAADLLA